MGSLSESLVSFFKVMVEDDFSRVLKLPPKFARTATHLLNKETYLENLKEQRWYVVVSKENGSLAFRKGWKEFSTAHNLKIGDLVVFHYFVTGYFNVQVFNSSACDVRGVSMGNVGPSKRRRYEMNPVDTYGSTRARHGPSAAKQNSPGEEYSNDSVVSASDNGHVHIHDNKNAIDASPITIVPPKKSAKRKAEQANYEDPEVQLMMIGRGISNEQREDRNVIDLSEYELPSADVECNRRLASNGWSLPYAETAVKCKAEPGSTEFANIKQEMSCHVELPESAVGKEVAEFTSLKREMKGHIEFPEPAKGKDVTEFTRLKQEMKCYADFPGSAVEKKDTKFTNVKQEMKSHVEFPESAKGNKVQRRLNSDVKHIIHGATTVDSLVSTDLSSKNGAHFPNLIIPKTGYEAAKPDTPFQSGKALVKVKKEIQTEPFEETGLALVTGSASDLHCRERSASSMFLELPGSLPRDERKDVTEFTRLKQEMKCHTEFPGSAVEKKVTKFANVKQEMKCPVEFPESTKGNKVQTRLNFDVKHIIYGATTVGSLDSTDLSSKNGAHFPYLSTPKRGYEAAKPDAPFQSGKALVKVKKEIQTEPFEETGLTLVTASANDLHCRIRSASSMFLELPGSLPLFTSTPSASESKLVILRDAAERVWPVFYHDKPSMKLLTTGWPAFQKANNIQPGDTCIFKADPGANLTYEVSIVRKENKPT